MSNIIDDLLAAEGLIFDYDGTIAITPDDSRQSYYPATMQRVLSDVGTFVTQTALLTGRPVDSGDQLTGGVFDLVAGDNGGEIIHHHGNRPHRWAAEGFGSDSRVRTFVHSDAVQEQLAHVGVEPVDQGATFMFFHPNTSAADGAFAAIKDRAREAGLIVQELPDGFALRPCNVDKGEGLRRLIEPSREQLRRGVHALNGAQVVAYFGDHPAYDPPAYAMGDRLVRERVLTRFIGIAAHPALAKVADHVVDGPNGVAHLLLDLLWAHDLRAR